MNITVKAFENADPDSAIKAHVNMTIDNAFVVKNLAVVQGKNGLFLNMPHHKSNEVDENGKAVYKDDAFPLNKDLRDKLQDAAVSSYQKGGQEVGFTFDAKTRETYEKYRKSGYSRKFYEANREELQLHKAAKEAFNALGLKKLPSVKELNEEFQTLVEEKRRAYVEYREAKEKMQAYAIARQNIEEILHSEEREKEQRKEIERIK